MTTPDQQPKPDGGPAFASAAGTGDPRDGIYCQNGMSLRDYLAAKETLAEWDHPEASMSRELGELLAGEPQPTGGWSGNQLDMIRWEAKWRAALKYIRSDAMLAERSRV